jgi:hypothetical protein
MRVLVRIPATPPLNTNADGTTEKKDHFIDEQKGNAHTASSQSLAETLEPPPHPPHQSAAP